MVALGGGVGDALGRNLDRTVVVAEKNIFDGLLRLSAHVHVDIKISVYRHAYLLVDGSGGGVGASDEDGVDVAKTLAVKPVNSTLYIGVLKTCACKYD